MLNDSVRVSAAPGFQSSLSLGPGQGAHNSNSLEPQDVFLDSRGMLVAMPRTPSVLEFESWNFVV